MYIYIYRGTFRLRIVKHSTVKGCTNIYCVIDFAAKPSTGFSSVQFNRLSTFDFSSGPWPFLFAFPIFRIYSEHCIRKLQWESGGANIKYHPARIRNNRGKTQSEGLASWLDVKFNFTQCYWMAWDGTLHSNLPYKLRNRALKIYNNMQP